MDNSFINLAIFCKISGHKKKAEHNVSGANYFFGNAVIFTKLVNAWQPKPVQLPAGKSYEAGILLGGLGSFDKNGNGFLNNASDRFAETAILYKTGKIKRIIISGGNISKGRPKEADFLYKKFIDLGIPAHDLIAENKSQTTFENAAFTKKSLILSGCCRLLYW